MDGEEDDDNDFEFMERLKEAELAFANVDSEADDLINEAAGDWRVLTQAVLCARMTRIAVPSEPPYMLGRYEALDTVTGGMGMVVIGRDPELERKVAMKLWKAEGPAAEAALLAEARTLASLKHTNIVSVFDVGRYRSSMYFVMESADGINGHEWIREHAPNWQEVLEVFMAAGSGLAAAHVAGIAHRDFKPANMLVGDDGRVLVLDFGIAAALLSTSESSERELAPDVADSERGSTGAGTVAYMAPERIRGRPGDARSDQFSFCVSMWEALHRVRPYRGHTSDVLLESIACGAIRTGSSTAGVPHWLSRIVRKGLSEDPDLRYRSMNELLAALREGSSGGEAVDGEAVDVALSGGAGRLLNKPGTGAHGGSAELDALVDEVAKRLQLKAGARKDEYLVRVTGDLPAPRRSPKGLSVVVSVASVVSAAMSAAVLTLVIVMLRPPTAVPVEPPEVATVEEDPLEAILSHVAAGRFGKAEELWYERRRENASDEQDRRLSDDDSLAIGRACLARAKQLESKSRKTTSEAAKMARDIAMFLMRDALKSETREAAGQLFRDVNNFERGRPAATTSN